MFTMLRLHLNALRLNGFRFVEWIAGWQRTVCNEAQKSDDFQCTVSSAFVCSSEQLLLCGDGEEDLANLSQPVCIHCLPL